MLLTPSTLVALAVLTHQLPVSLCVTSQLLSPNEVNFQEKKPAAGKEVEKRANDEDYCCMPVKWHSRMSKTAQKTVAYLRFAGDAISEESEQPQEMPSPIQLEVFVNHRRPRFELRNVDLGVSMLFWRGHMWLLKQGARWPQLMNAVLSGYRPSGGLAPLFFRCLAPGNGFQRINATLYRLTEPDEGPFGRRLGLGTVTDIRVVPTTLGVSRHGQKQNCQLSGFTVISSYLKPIPGKGPAVVRETDAYFDVGGGSSNVTGWPDQLLTQRLQNLREFYREQLRTGAVKVNKPHLTVPVT